MAFGELSLESFHHVTWAAHCAPPTLPLRSQVPNLGNTQLVRAARRHQRLVCDYEVYGARLAAWVPCMGTS
jgi:hypothetical protein